MSRFLPALSRSLPLWTSPVTDGRGRARGLVPAWRQIGRAGRKLLSLVMLVAALGGCFASLTSDAPDTDDLTGVAIAGPGEAPAPTVGERAEVDDAQEDGDDDVLDEAADVPGALAFVSSVRKPNAARAPGRLRSRLPAGRLFRPPRA